MQCLPASGRASRPRCCLNGVGARSAAAMEMEVHYHTLQYLATHDGVNVMRSVAAEHIARRLLQQSRAVKRSGQRPDYEGLEVYLRHLGVRPALRPLRCAGPQRPGCDYEARACCQRRGGSCPEASREEKPRRQSTRRQSATLLLGSWSRLSHDFSDVVDMAVFFTIDDNCDECEGPERNATPPPLSLDAIPASTHACPPSATDCGLKEANSI